MGFPELWGHLFCPLPRVYRSRRRSGRGDLGTARACCVVFVYFCGRGQGGAGGKEGVRGGRSTELLRGLRWLGRGGGGGGGWRRGTSLGLTLLEELQKSRTCAAKRVDGLGEGLVWEEGGGAGADPARGAVARRVRGEEISDAAAAIDVPALAQSHGRREELEACAAPQHALELAEPGVSQWAGGNTAREPKRGWGPGRREERRASYPSATWRTVGSLCA